MTTNTDIEQLKRAYSDVKVSDNYIRERFSAPLGRLLHERQAEFVVNALRRFNIKNVLEIAPGPARLTVDIGSACPDTSGTIMDVNQNMLDQADKRLRAAGLGERWRSVQGDAFALPFTECFDMVYSFRFIRHFRGEDRRKIYRQIHDHLNPQGYLVFDVVNRSVSAPLRANALPGEYPIYDELYDLAELEKELKENGFRVLNHQEVQRNFLLLGKMQILLAPHTEALAYLLMKAIDRFGAGKPLEWIVLCQKI